MTDLDRAPSESQKCWPTFTNEQTIAGIKLLDLIEWVSTSNRVLNGGEGPEDMPVIAMPPMQRTAVWRPKQTVDLWDSLMRGLPIGAFYLVEQREGSRMLVRLENARNGNSHTRTQESSRAGFELLDGQQRVRALLAGVHGPAEAKLCLWVDLGAEDAAETPCLRATSKAQPFGYDAETGNKLSLEQRRTARKEIEPCPKTQPLKLPDRPAYNLDLFDGEVTRDGERIEQPPRPYRASNRIFKLHDLLRAWKKRAAGKPDAGVAALRGALPEGLSASSKLDLALRVLDEAFQRVEKAQVALLRVEPGQFRTPEHTLLTLFERIGAGGTPLSAEERLFSIYKHYVPEVRDVVDRIYLRAGRVLPPTKIAATALRIANTNGDSPRYTVPDVGSFVKQMAVTPPSELRRALDELIPPVSAEAGRSEALLGKSFEAVKNLLSYAGKDDDAFWVPDVMLTSFPAELWQVLVYWETCRLHGSEPAADLASARPDVVRFALFWHIFVWNNEKAARQAFEYLNEYLKQNTGTDAFFPGRELYRLLIGAEGRERCAFALTQPDEFKSRLSKGRSPVWTTDKERFGEGAGRNEVSVHWWWSARKALPWLQRGYVRREFPGYVPLTDHEDDVPYDFDHICPHSDWGRNWTPFETALRKADCLDDKQLASMRYARFVIGDAIGNFRLIEASTNRIDSNKDIACKMPFVTEENVFSKKQEQEMIDTAFNLDQREVWHKASGEDMAWDAERLCAFQEAVEQRTLWLYECFYKHLSFEDWTSSGTEAA